MRVIIANQSPASPMTNVAQPPPHYAVGRLDGYGGDRILVAGLPEAGAALVAFSRETGEFMCGPNLNYLDFVIFNREAIEENIGPQPKEATAVDYREMLHTGATVQDVQRIQQEMNPANGRGLGIGLLRR